MFKYLLFKIYNARICEIATQHRTLKHSSPRRVQSLTQQFKEGYLKFFFSMQELQCYNL